MGCKELIPLFRFFGTFLCPILYFISFASVSWVTFDNYELGLWKWCYTNFTDHDSPEDFVNDTARCHDLKSGSLPGYYEAVGVFACFALVSFVAFFFTFNENEGLGKDIKPVGVAGVSCVLTTTTITILAQNYERDESWGKVEFSLGWCFWMAMASGCLSACMVVTHHQHIKLLSSSPSSSSVAPMATKSKSRPNRKPNAPLAPSGSGSTSAAKTTTSSTTTTNTVANAVTNTNTSSTQGGLAKNKNNTASRWSQLPVLRFPVYGVPREPEDLPECPPPSYDAVMGDGEDSYAPPPSVHLP